MPPPVGKSAPTQPVKTTEDAPPAPPPTAPKAAPLTAPPAMCMKDDPPAKPKPATLPPPTLKMGGVTLTGVPSLSLGAAVFRPLTEEEEREAKNRAVAQSLKEGMDAKPAEAKAPGIPDPGIGKYVGGVPGGGDVGVGVRIDGDPGVSKPRVTVEGGAKTPLGGVGVKIPVAK